MKTLVVNSFGENPQMCIEERPKPIWKEGYSLIKIHATTVNPLSHLVRSGKIAHAKAPIVLSNDGSGVIEQSARFLPGTHVAIFGGADLGIKEDGLQQQWVLVEDKRVIKLPIGFDLNSGAALPINYVTAFQALTRVAKIRAGQKILISGASGSVGHALIQISNALGAFTIAMVSSPAKADFARRSQAKAVIDISYQDLNAEVMMLTNGQGADLAFDTVGGHVMSKMLSVLRLRGSIISIGFVGGDTASIDVADLVVNEKRILGYDAWLETDTDINNAIERLCEFINDGKIQPTIDSIYQLEHYADAYKRLTSRQAAGTILLQF